MKSFKEIFNTENMVMPKKNVAKQVQNFNPSQSVQFDLDDESQTFLKANLPFNTINRPTLKKFAENIIILNRMKDAKTGQSKMQSMNMAAKP